MPFDLSVQHRPMTSPPSSTIALLSGALRDNRETALHDQGLGHQQIAAAFEAWSASGNPGVLAGLVGTGGGLTPSGDDVVVGMLAGFDVATGYEPMAATARNRLLRALPGPLELHTPRHSAQMIEAASIGQYPEPLLAVADALALHDTHPPAAAIRVLLSLGHDSGWHMLKGFTEAIGAAKSCYRSHLAPPANCL